MYLSARLQTRIVTLSTARRSAVALATLLLAGLTVLDAAPARAQSNAIDVDILFNYYDQDGDHSPVTGGIGTEDLQVVAPVIVLRWAVDEKWQLSADVGLDSITSASTDNIDDDVSSASEVDARGHGLFSARRRLGERDALTLSLGFSSEYDYTSVNGRIGWERTFNNKNTTFAAGIGIFEDTVELYDIDGIQRGESDRSTTNLSLSLSHVFSERTVGGVELSVTDQSGFLSTPFHEVILAPTAEYPEGLHIAERLPDRRKRLALGLRVRHAWTQRIVQRFEYRYYDDDWGVSSNTFETEIHFRLPGKQESWIFPILRFHDQTGSDYFGLPRTFTATDPFFTADRDLSGFASEKFGLGWNRVLAHKDRGWLRKRLRGFETRISQYSRDDGLDAISVSFAVSLRFRGR